MTLRLYHADGTRSDRVRWLLRELEAPHALVQVDLKANEHRRPEFLTLSPHGTVPVLVDGSATLDDPAAIVLHLADRFAHRGLCPPVGSPARARYYQYVLLASELDALYARLPSGRVDLAPDDRARLAQHLRVLSGRLAPRAHLLGPGFSAADLCIADALGALDQAGFVPFEDTSPALRDYLVRVLARPTRVPAS